MKRTLAFLLGAFVALSWPGVAQPQASVTLSPKQARPNQPVDLTFQVKEGGQTLTDFEVVHEKTSHLILVSQDYTDFQHIHPTLDRRGQFAMKRVVFRNPGLYYVFLDVTPQGSKQIVKRFDLQVKGQGKPLVLRANTQDQKIGDLTVHFETEPTVLKKGDAMLRFQVSRKGKPVSDLEPFMGAMGHVIALGKNGAPFLHIHPVEGKDAAQHAAPTAAYTCEMHPEVQSTKPGSCPKCNMSLISAQQAADFQKMTVKPGEILFHANFPSPGLYKVWGQFQRKGAMVIAPFTVKVN